MTNPRTPILGAAGRDFHNFNVVYRDNPDVEVVAFTAAQITGIAGRTYPPELAGPLYPQGIPIVAEDQLESMSREYADAGKASLTDVLKYLRAIRKTWLFSSPVSGTSTKAARLPRRQHA